MVCRSSSDQQATQILQQNQRLTRDRADHGQVGASGQTPRGRNTTARQSRKRLRERPEIGASTAKYSRKCGGPTRRSFSSKRHPRIGAEIRGARRTVPPKRGANGPISHRPGGRPICASLVSGSGRHAGAGTRADPGAGRRLDSGVRGVAEPQHSPGRN